MHYRNFGYIMAFLLGCCAQAAQMGAAAVDDVELKVAAAGQEVDEAQDMAERVVMLERWDANTEKRKQIKLAMWNRENKKALALIDTLNRVECEELLPYVTTLPIAKAMIAKGARLKDHCLPPATSGGCCNLDPRVILFFYHHGANPVAKGDEGINPMNCLLKHIFKLNFQPALEALSYHIDLGVSLEPDSAGKTYKDFLKEANIKPHTENLVLEFIEGQKSKRKQDGGGRHIVPHWIIDQAKKMDEEAGKELAALREQLANPSSCCVVQ